MEIQQDERRRQARRWHVLHVLFASLLAAVLAEAASAEAAPSFEDAAQDVLAAKCFRCHGEDRLKRKAELDLRTAKSILAGGESGPAVIPGKPEESPLWQMIDSGAMPPEGATPLNEQERKQVEAWIKGGAKSKVGSEEIAQDAAGRDFWSFRALARPALPDAALVDRDATPLDRFIFARLAAKNLSFAPVADRRTLARRVYLDLIGLPPSPAQVDQFANDPAPDAYERLVDSLLASPQYGERWARQWLDVVGYADSNGYHRADSPRPLAYHYRDYVIRSLNDDKPYDRFWVEQLAGDELVNYPGVERLGAADRERLIATHYLRNGPDGTDDTEGNEMARVMERYAVLESQLQITMSAMFGMTIDCARCHSHKFDPIPQRDYYALQAIFYPAFNVKQWVQPKERTIHAAGKAELADWKDASAAADREISRLQEDFDAFVASTHKPGRVRFADDFSSGSVESNWSDTAPGDDRPAGSPAVQLGGAAPPAARAETGRLALLAPPGSQGAWLATKQAFDWTPDHAGGWIQATFDLVETQLGDGKPAERIGFYIALHDFNDNGTPGGNILFDGNPAGGAQAFVDYPGRDQKSVGKIGAAGYQPAHNFGVRVTRVADDEFAVQHLVDGVTEGASIHLKAADLPDGGFGFELCCGRSYAVDNVVVEGSLKRDEEGIEASAHDVTAAQIRDRYAALSQSIAAVNAKRVAEPERIAWITDLSDAAPEVRLLKRGDYFQPGPMVEPGTLSVLVDDNNKLEIAAPKSGAKSTGRRLAFAEWATRPNSRAAALLARVHVDRLWRGHFGQGLSPTPENFGASGLPPTHPELLEWLACELVEGGWKQKAIHRAIVLSRTYRQSSIADEAALERDSTNALYGRFPAHRLDAEVIRDAMLAVSGKLNPKMGGPAVATVDKGTRQIVLETSQEAVAQEAHRRSVYIRHRRTQPLSFLQAFDKASPEPNCVARPVSTVVAQSLAMINGEFAVQMGRELAARIEREGAADRDTRVRRAFQLSLAREPSLKELRLCGEFLEQQAAARAKSEAEPAEWAAFADLCRMLMATSEFAYAQ